MRAQGARDLLRLAALIRPHWRRAALGTALALATVLANIGLLALSSWFIASMALAGALGASMDYTLPAVGVRAFAIIRAVGRYAERLVNHDTTFRILGSLRLWFYGRIEPLAPARLAGFRSGDLLARIRSDIDVLDDYYVRGLVPALVAVLALSCIFSFLSRYDLRIARIDILALVAAGLLVPIALAVLAGRPGRESVLAAAELRSSIVEEVEGMAELVVLGAAKTYARATDEVAARLDERQRRLNSLRGIGDASVLALGSLAVWSTAGLLVGLVGSGRLPRADMAMLTVFVLASFETIVPLPVAIQKAGEMAQAARRLFEIIDAEPAVPARAPSIAPRRAADAEDEAPRPRPAAAGLAIRDLRFAIRPGLSPRVRRFLARPGPGNEARPDGPFGCRQVQPRQSPPEILGLRGRADRARRAGPPLLRSGRGARLLFGGPSVALPLSCLDPREPAFGRHAGGRTTGRGGREAPHRGRRGGPALGPRGTSRPPASTPSSAKTGRAVSVGEAQRIAVARAFLKDAPILLLDEPTEGLDDATADALLAAIAERAAGRTLVMISHRERDLGIVDTICRLHSG